LEFTVTAYDGGDWNPATVNNVERADALKTEYDAWRTGGRGDDPNQSELHMWECILAAADAVDPLRQPTDPGLVEQVAQAIHAAKYQAPWSHYSANLQDVYRNYARAAIGAMPAVPAQPPTDAVLEADGCPEPMTTRYLDRLAQSSDPVIRERVAAAQPPTPPTGQQGGDTDEDEDYTRPDGIVDTLWMKPHRDLADSLPVSDEQRAQVNTAFDAIYARTIEERTGEHESEHGLLMAIMRRAAPPTRTDTPKEEACSTCEGAGEIRLERQIGAPGSGGWLSCPDCQDLPVRSVDHPDNPPEHHTDTLRPFLSVMRRWPRSPD
jgi:hypothetical protein